MTMTTTATDPPRAGRKEWIGLAVLMLPTLLIAIDASVLHLAVPTLSEELAPSSSQLLWIVDIYGFLIAGSLITMGTLGDRIGSRKLLLIGAAAFGLASILAAFAPNAEMLIASRALLGVAGATLMPSTQSLIRTMFHHPGQRTVAIGVWASGFSAGSAIGPLLGGWLIERFWWGSVFLAGVPAMVLLLILGPLFLPEHRDPAPSRFDLASAVQSLAAVLAVIYGVKRTAEHGVGWLAGLVIAGGLAIGFVFLRRQRALSDPLLDLSLFGNRAFSTALATNTLVFFGQFGLLLFTAQYLQSVLGLSPLEAGLWTLPSAGAYVVGSNLAPRMARWVQPVVTITSGLLISAAGYAMLLQIDRDSLDSIVVASIVIAIGFGLAGTLILDMILTAVRPERAGTASAISETGVELGGALGIAILGSIGAAVYRREMTNAVPADVPADASRAAADTLGGAVSVSDQIGPALVDTARDAFIQGFHVTAVISALALVGMATLVVAVLRHHEASTAPEGQPMTEAGHSQPLPPVRIDATAEATRGDD